MKKLPPGISEEEVEEARLASVDGTVFFTCCTECGKWRVAKNFKKHEKTCSSYTTYEENINNI